MKPAGQSGLGRSWLFAIAVLSAAPVLRAGDVQAIEIAQVLCLALALPLFLYGGLRVPSSGTWRQYGVRYLLFLSLCLAGAALSLRLTFYAPPGISLLKQPFFLSLSRILELSLAVLFMLMATRAFTRSRDLLRLTLDAYIWAGSTSALFSIASWVLMKVANIYTFAIYGYDGRARGFFNEGGPFGLFLVSVAVACLLRAQVFPRRYPAVTKALLGLLAGALFLSGSKAGILLAIGLGTLTAIITGSHVRKLAIAGASAAILLVFVTFFQTQLAGYFYSYLNFDEAVSTHAEDPSLIMGRIAGMIIVPRMVAEHPLLGVGIGNYSLMRNDPTYLQGLPAVDDWDLPGVGLLGSAAEFGIPLTLFFLVVLLRPLLAANRRKCSAIIVVAAGFQPLAFLLGVNLNFFYPWLVAAFAIAAQSIERESARGARC